MRNQTGLIFIVSSIFIFSSVSPISSSASTRGFAAIFDLVVTHKREHSVDCSAPSPLSRDFLCFFLIPKPPPYSQTAGFATGGRSAREYGNRYLTSLLISPTNQCVGACYSDRRKMSLALLKVRHFIYLFIRKDN
jgi:hypothetical protein